MAGQVGMDGALGALGSAAAGLGGLVGEVATSLTGSQELGELAGVAVNLLTGNVPGAVAEGVALGKDVIETPRSQMPGCPPPPSGADAAATAPPPSATHQGHPASPAGLRGHPARPAGPRGHASGPATGLQAILGDGSLSIEDKVAMLLSSLVDGLDGQIKDEMGQLASAQEGGSGGKAAGDVQQLQTKLQMLMQRRSQMLTLLSNLEGMFNQTSMQVISNIR